MLENSLWRKYNKTNNYKEHIARWCKMEIEILIQDEQKLYEVLKAKLTKKELKLFAMDSAIMSEEELKSALNLNDETLEKAKEKLYKKLKQDKVRLAFRASHL